MSEETSMFDMSPVLTHSYSDEFSKLNTPITTNYYYPKEKNRYSSIIPNETTRIHLSQKEGQEHSDYINANLVSMDIGAKEPARYVACQGPLESTVADFWRMCWELVRIIRIISQERTRLYWRFKSIIVEINSQELTQLTARKIGWCVLPWNLQYNLVGTAYFITDTL
jgi:protein tyrosine phosphatase